MERFYGITYKITPLQQIFIINLIFLKMIIIPCWLLMIFIATEVATFSVYGRFISKEVTDTYMNLDESKLILNKYNPSILETNMSGFITNIPFSIFSKYYISGLGTIPKWSKLHKRVEEYFAIASRNNLPSSKKQTFN